MKTAVLISGHLRTLEQCLLNQHWMAYRKLPEPAFFISCVDDDRAIHAERFRVLYPQVFIERVVQPQIVERPEMTKAMHHAPFAVTPTKQPGVGAVQGMLRAFWHLRRAWEFFGECANRADYDLVMWSRGDLFFHHYALPPLPLAQNAAHLPWWGLYGGYSTSAGLFGLRAAEAYFTMFDSIANLLAMGCPFHPETLVAGALELKGIQVHPTLAADFAFVRDDCVTDMTVSAEEIARYAAALVRQGAPHIPSATPHGAPFDEKFSP